ncbi:spore maturation protein [Salipaludibacillus agaradhaerens]|uniref:nucleoside recognition domain-containing protein n=1 Tax=Salipaludibacillus agaradhaerens TaxID=76935 RepID=UPI002151C4FF|nr:nucleoside recognition domain-containing protein [Salipaludibacillus agaradhaerens]MCR6106526.1 spore maturation protein [Salipaludibacillus agaradhaerens]MCR6118559.1 spore maturation protein [Salipaludibacillus agaradhaerens]UJW57650.1 spore maturation protein [Bacillus sp. A116_S68]
MVNIIWVGLFVVGFMFAAINGNMEQVNEAVFSGAKEAVTICIGLISILTFWLGMMRIAEVAGMLRAVGRVLQPFVRKLFPDIPKDHPAIGYIISNMSANLFGLGNAATPMGIKAMKELKELNNNKDEASRSMITLLAINTASITLIPTTVISLRIDYQSAAPTEIVMTTIMATACSTIGAILIDRYFYYRRLRKGCGGN